MVGGGGVGVETNYRQQCLSLRHLIDLCDPVKDTNQVDLLGGKEPCFLDTRVAGFMEHRHLRDI